MPKLYKCKIITNTGWMLLFWLFGSAVCSWSSESHIDDAIVAIHSYTPAYTWTDRQIEGLEDALGPCYQNRLYHEFLDSKRIDSGDEYRAFVSFVSQKYAGKNLRAIVATDDHALRCAKLVRKDLKLDVPIFFSGINSVHPEDYDSLENMTGVIEKLDASDTIAFAFQQFPKIKKIYLLSEYTLSGDLICEGLLGGMSIPTGVNVERLPNLVHSDQIDFVKRLPEDSMVLVVAYKVDAEGKLLNQMEATEDIANMADVPVFICYDFGICESMIGGKTLDSYDSGFLVGEQLVSFLSGTAFEDIPVCDDYLGKWHFSIHGIDRFGISESSLPEKSELLFVEDSFWAKYFLLMVGILVFVSIQAFLIVVLLKSRIRLKKFTSELQESKKDMSSWIIHAPLPVSIFYQSGETRAINYQYSELLGYDVSDFRDGEEMWNVLIQDEFVRMQFLSEWKKLEGIQEDSSGVLPREVSVTTKSGAFKIIEVHVSVIGGFVVCFYNDVTWRSGMEMELEHALSEASEANAAKTQFLTNMSHEIRTPLNGVLGMTQLLSETKIDEEQKLFLETIQRSGEMLLLTINDILDLSKIESGQMSLEKIPFNLRKTIEDSVSICLPKLNEGDVVFRSSIDEALPEELLGDTYRISQIIVNLLSNAFKYTEEGVVELLAECESVEDGKATLCIQVKDSGVGIPLEKQHAIFEPFTQADASNTRQFGGTGLGLTICRKLADMMNGEISVNSSVGRGSVFEFRWETSVVVSSEKSPVLEVNGRSDRSDDMVVSTLVVEDNAVNFKVIELSLKKLGVRPVRAENGRIALEILRKQSFDLVFMDIQMPEMDGLTATKKIRSEFPSDQQPFIIALTAHALADHIEQCRLAQMNGFLSKPFTKEDLQSGMDLYQREKDSDKRIAYF